MFNILPPPPAKLFPPKRICLAILPALFVGNTNSLSNSFTSNTTQSVSVQSGFGGRIFGVSFGAKGTSTWSTSNSQQSANSTTVTTSVNVERGEITYGTGDYFAPVDHDYDTIWVWLNPALIFSVSGNLVTWEGYGFDEADQFGMEIVPVALGYLNGDWGNITNWQYYPNSQRTWAASTESFPPGQSAALDSNDFAAIEAADPFSISNYGSTYIGTSPPQQTSDGRFTFALCNSENSFNYQQGYPSQPASIVTCDLTYTSLTTLANSMKNTTSQEFATDLQLSTTFLKQFQTDLKTSNTLTWTTTAQQSITNSTTLKQAMQNQGSPCNNSVPNQAPCIPIYGQSSGQPGEFFVYQDNLYGTFMFAPVNFY